MFLKDLSACLKTLDLLMQSHPGPIPHSLQLGGDPIWPHLTICCAVHGNEVGSLPAALHLFERLAKTPIATRPHVVVTLIIGNPPAIAQNTRFVGSDLNRAFAPGKPPSTQEDHRAQEIRSHLSRLKPHFDLVIDLHQTILPSRTPFWVFGFHYESWLWMRVLGGTPHFVTRPEGQSFSAQQMALDECAQSLGVAGLTLELGEQGIRPLATRTAFGVLERAVSALARLARHPDGLKRMAHRSRKRSQVKVWTTTHKHPFSSPTFQLRSGLVNFAPIAEGEKLGHDSATGNALLAAASGRILFPKYPPRGTDGQALDPRPGDLWHEIRPWNGPISRLRQG